MTSASTYSAGGFRSLQLKSVLDLGGFTSGETRTSDTRPPGGMVWTSTLVAPPWVVPLELIPLAARLQSRSRLIARTRSAN